MRSRKTAAIILIFVFTLTAVTLMGRSNSDVEHTKMLDLKERIHKVGNIWLRVSNYGFFGSGDDVTPQWPSLEYPGGSGIDYLFQGALWFGAKKIRKSQEGDVLYWIHWPPEDETDYCTEKDTLIYEEGMHMIIDTLVSVGFDGDRDIMEFLPAYNPAEENALEDHDIYDLIDTVMTASIWNSRAGVDDDGDGMIDEDPAGYAFPMRSANELPEMLWPVGGQYLGEDSAEHILEAVDEEIWFPLGFVDLSVATDGLVADIPGLGMAFTKQWDDDLDGLYDEDGYPMSEQDYISYYYDFCPFPEKTGVDRHYGDGTTSNNHIPLGVMIRQMSYQWSYDYIKNLVYIEFDITNMNEESTLYDCAMGVYMDSDVGPQSWGDDERSKDDISSYVAGEGYEFAYTYDADQDQGLTTGYMGSRVCTPIPHPDSLNYSCWYWNRGDGPDDLDPRDLTPTGSPTSNEKYWLLVGQNPDPDDYVSLRDFPEHQMSDPDDTRYLFAFSGDGQGLTDPSDESWNLEPKKTMKIVVAVFPGESVPELKQTAEWAKEIYGEAQSLTTAVLPDTFPHYNPPEPPEAPKVHVNVANGQLHVFWDNRSEFTYDVKAVSKGKIGYQNSDPELVECYDPDIVEGMPDYNPNAIVDPITADRLRHDFQGYSVWTRSGSGLEEDWMMHRRWDKIDTDQDRFDYDITIDKPQANYWNFGGELGVDRGLPYENEEKYPGNPPVVDSLNYDYHHQFYRLNDLYELVQYERGDPLYGLPLYDPAINNLSQIQMMVNGLTDISINPKYHPGYSIKQNEQLIFKNPDVDVDVYLALVDDRLIPISGHAGQSYIDEPDFTEKYQERMARRYYSYIPGNPGYKGIERYVTVTAFDRGMPSNNLLALESSKAANMQVWFPGTVARESMDNIYVVPNPYIGLSDYDGRRENDPKGDKSRRIWFANLPERCTIRIFTLAGDLVEKIEHYGSYEEDVITTSKASYNGKTETGIHSWDILSKNHQIVVSGVYLFSVENRKNGEVKVGKFVIIR